MSTLTVNFASAEIDRPAGRVDVLPSAISGRFLRYVTPEPLEALFSRCATVEPVPVEEQSVACSLALLAAAARTTTHGMQARREMSRWASMLLRREPSPSTKKEFIDLARDIDPANAQIRNEIVFSGGRTSSSSDHVFPAHQELPQLLEQLASGLASRNENLSPLARAALIHFFSVSIHPFIDGNGRWAKAVTLRDAAGRNSHWSGAVAVAYNLVSKDRIVKHESPEAITSGLRTHVLRLMEYEIRLKSKLRERGLLDGFSSLGAILAKRARGRSLAALYVRALFDGEICTDDIRSVGVSDRVARGVCCAILRLSPTLVREGPDGSASMMSLIQTVETAVQEAAEDVATVISN